MPWRRRLLNHHTHAGSARIDLVITTDDVALGGAVYDWLFNAQVVAVLQGFLSEHLADLRTQIPPVQEQPQEEQQQPPPPPPRDATDPAPEPDAEEAPAAPGEPDLPGAIPPPGCPALPCPGASRGISQARIDRAWRIGKRAGDVLGGRERLHAPAEAMPADAAAPRASCWAVALMYKEDAPRVTFHRYATDTLAEATGLAVMYQGYRIRIERPAGVGRNVVFQGFPSLQEAFAFAASIGVEQRSVPINPFV